MSEVILHGDPQERAPDVAPVGAGSDRPPAWEEIEPGRFMPRRVRGSFPGGKLG